MSRVAGVFMALVLAVCCYALDNVADSGRVSLPNDTESRVEANRKNKEEDHAHERIEVDEHGGGTDRESPDNAVANALTAIGTIVIAVFTVVLARTSWLQWRAIKKANEVARDAADATKRSVDAYIGRERGRLVIGECYRPDRLSNQIKFHYTNEGPTELTIMSFGAIPVLHVFGEDFSIPVIPTAIATEVVKPGEEFGGGTRNGLFFRGVPGSITIPYEMFMRLSNETNVRALAAFRMTYTTAFGHYVKQQVFVLENHGPIDIGYRDLCYDLPHAEWVEKYGKKEEKK